jgi:hypothetical protein
MAKDRNPIGVLLINLGTPDAPEVRAVRRYLAEFLSDPRVVEIPAIAWKPILYGIVLRLRPRRSAEAYNQIWTNEGSPLAVIARRQAHALSERFKGRALVDYAMRYGNPGIAEAIERMVGALVSLSSSTIGCQVVIGAPVVMSTAARFFIFENFCVPSGEVIFLNVPPTNSVFPFLARA